MLANKKKSNFMGNLIKGKKGKEEKKLERFPPSLFNQPILITAPTRHQ